MTPTDEMAYFRDMDPDVYGINTSMTVSHSNYTPNQRVNPDSNDTAYEAFDRAIHYLNEIGIPLLVIFGCVGNMLSLVVFVSTHLRYQSSSVYLAFLNVVDTGFLLNLFLTWFSWLDIRLFHRQGWCQLVIYFTFVFGFLSVWTVVAFTVERFIVVFRPLRRQQWCTRRRAKIVLGSLTGFSVVFYSFPLWCAKVDYEDGRSRCTYNANYRLFLMIMTLLDTLITLVIPSLAIVILNGGITYKICHFFRSRFHVDSDQTAPCSSSSSSGNPHEVKDAEIPLRWPPTPVNKQSDVDSSGSRARSLSTNHQFRTGCTARPPDVAILHDRKRPTSAPPCVWQMEQFNQSNRRIRQIRTTRTLLIVSTVFVMLNLPSHAFRIYHVMLGLIYADQSLTSAYSYLWQQFLQLIYHINFAINFVLYIACSRSFRVAFWRLFRRLVVCIRKKARTPQEPLEAIVSRTGEAFPISCCQCRKDHDII